MSMAEPRRRQKWSLNPRGSLWANDDSKFGQKLMEKMGWSKGHGLGREEQGMKDPLSVKLKDDNKGIGYKGSDDEWIKHYEDFENVLANLNKQDNTPTNGTTDSSSDSTEAPTHGNVGKTSLESSSKASRSRVHYHKFTRGKDLSRCTEDDLGCILGSKRAKQLAKEKKCAETEEVNDVDEVGHVNHSMGLTTIKGCFMQDYFAQKMEAFRNRAKSQPQTVAEESHCDDEEEDVGRPGLGMNAGGGDLTPDSPNGEEENREERRKKKKKKKKHQVETEEINPAETISEECCVEVENNVPKKKKKKKKQKSSDFIDTDENACEANGVEVSTEDTAQINPVVDEETQRKKKKKKKKHSDAVEEQTLNDETEEQLKVKKKKKRKHAEVTDENNPSHCLAVEENNQKKKKKKKLKDKE